MIRRDEVIAYVLEHPDSTSVDVAVALGSDTHVVGSHLARAAKDKQITQLQVTGRDGKFAYGPPGWTKPRKPKPTPAPSGDVPDVLRARLAVVQAELERLEIEEEGLRAALVAYDRIGAQR